MEAPDSNSTKNGFRLDCEICLRSFSATKKVRQPYVGGKCGHSFCGFCTSELKKKGSCPHCRAPFVPVKNFMLIECLENMDKMKKQLREEKKKMNEKLIKAGVEVEEEEEEEESVQESEEENEEETEDCENEEETDDEDLILIPGPLNELDELDDFFVRRVRQIVDDDNMLEIPDDDDFVENPLYIPPPQREPMNPFEDARQAPINMPRIPPPPFAFIPPGFMGIYPFQQPFFPPSTMPVNVFLPPDRGQNHQQNIHQMGNHRTTMEHMMMANGIQNQPAELPYHLRFPVHLQNPFPHRAQANQAIGGYPPNARQQPEQQAPTSPVLPQYPQNPLQQNAMQFPFWMPNAM